MDTSDLTARIARLIAAQGPIPVAAFMALALHDPAAGYYATRSPLGRGGDFITAPEISQIFGELIGLWCADLWQRMGRPNPVLLVELGPGRGVLMEDLLRAAAAIPGFRRAVRLHLVEASPILRAEQQRRLAAASPVFAADFSEIPAGPLLLIANEFLDALPIRQLVRGRGGWAERFVALDDAGALVFADGRENPLLGHLVPAALRDSPPGSIAEICPAASTLIGAVAARLVEHPGAALLIDYGAFPSAPGPTLAAISGHAPAGVLDEPGGADLSAHVDFAAIADAARAAGAAVYGPVPQGRLLTDLGAPTRLAALTASEAERAALARALARLIDPGEMGTLFKALALTSPGLPAPAGFAADPPTRSG